MKIEFLGGAQTVTGSCYIISDADFTIMVDCGMFQGTNVIRERNFTHHEYIPKKIDAVLLTHAHIDHSGLLPKLVASGYYGNIYATKATTDLCSIMLPDSGHIQEMDAEYVNRKNQKLGRDPVKPLYSAEDAEKSLKNFVPVSYDEVIQVHPRVEVRFRNAGHILGASFIEMWIDAGAKKTKIVFSGDLGYKGQTIIRDPDTVDEADVLLIESTYGDRLHKNRENSTQEFRDVILESHNNKGNIIIPSFAVGRTQEIIYTLGKLFRSNEIPLIPVYIDSPLAISATEIFKKNNDDYDDDMRKIILSGDSPFDMPNLRYTRTTDESKWLNTEARGAIIISASGMCTAGRVKHHLKYNLYRPESSVIFVGFQAEGTLGRRLIDGAEQVRLYGTDVAVRAKIHTIGGFSAHADRDGLLAWVGEIRNPDLKVFIVHGEERSAQAFAGTLKKELGLSPHVPDWGEKIDLSTMQSEHIVSGKPKLSERTDSEMELLSQSLKDLIEKYNLLKNRNKTVEIRKIREDINDLRKMISMIIDEM